MIRLGLCCTFRDEPIKFRTLTATALKKLPRPKQLARIAEVCQQNSQALLDALRYCTEHGIGSFRINSQILPLKTHPQVGYSIADLPAGPRVAEQFVRCGDFARSHGLRTSFHPDQFVVLNSSRPEVVASSIRELQYQAEVAEWVGADVINIHCGGAYGDKRTALGVFQKNVDLLSDPVRSRLTIENDDTLYTPADLVPLSKSAGLPLVYDVHHHRCNPDAMTVEQATQEAAKTWNREPLVHISSPLAGWTSPRPRLHADYICVRDFPTSWLGRTATVDVEAKAKELAVERLKRWLSRVEAKAKARSL